MSYPKIMLPYTRLSAIWLLVGMTQFGISGITIVNGLDLGPNQPHYELVDSTPGEYSSDGYEPHQTMLLGSAYVTADDGSRSDLSSNPFPPPLSVLEPRKSAHDPTTITDAQQAIGSLFQSSPLVVASDKNNNDKSILAAEEGVSFSRSISQFPPDTSVTFEFLSNRTLTTTAMPVDNNNSNKNNGRDESSLERVCSTKDEYGDNNCHYKWDDGVVIKYLIEANTPFTEDDFIMGSFMVSPLDF
jgi:hypothetical protein